MHARLLMDPVVAGLLRMLVLGVLIAVGGMLAVRWLDIGLWGALPLWLAGGVIGGVLALRDPLDGDPG